MRTRNELGVIFMAGDRGYFELFDGDAVGYSELRRLYRGMCEDGNFDRVFSFGWVKTEDDFYLYASRDCWFYFGYSPRHELAGAIWFSDFRKYSCQIHICALEAYIPGEFRQSIEKLLQSVLDNSGYACYKIKAKTPYRGIERLFRGFGFRADSGVGKRCKLDMRGLYGLFRGK